MAVPPDQPKGVYPMYVFAEGRGSDISYADHVEERYLRLQHLDKFGRLKTQSPSKDSDDFVMLWGNQGQIV